MKYKTTKKSLKQHYGNKIITIGYYEAETLLKHEEVKSYCSGTYGHNCDNYEINGVLISIGCRPMKGKRNLKIIQKYEQLAKQHATNIIAIRQLLVEMVNKIMTGGD